MLALQTHLFNKLEERKANGILRELKVYDNPVDFYSNDYLGLSQNARFQAEIQQILSENPKSLLGSTGSRLISGNSKIITQTEDFLAHTHKTESALLFPSGYKANLALFSCIADRNDTILVDELIHRSVHDGCSLAKATKWKFRHNDLDHLESLLKKAKGNIILAIESLYSMDGDFAPLTTIADLALKYGANLIVDEAHAMGVFGKGLVDLNRLQEKVFATLVTYGKAMGLNGAAILGSQVLKNYLINFASPFIYSTAASDFLGLSIQKAYEFTLLNPHLAIELQNLIQHFRAYKVHNISQAKSPIQIVQFPSTRKLKNVVEMLAEAGFQTYAIFAPTIKEGSERLRICLHQFNTKEEIDKLCSIIKVHQQHA